MYKISNFVKILFAKKVREVYIFMARYFENNVNLFSVHLKFKIIHIYRKHFQHQRR